MRIREFTEQDAQPLSSLVEQAFIEANKDEFSVESRARLREKYRPSYFRAEADNKDIYVAQLRGDVVGGVQVVENTIDFLFVSPTRQSRGIGSGLLGYAENQISQQFSQARVFSGLNAIRFYEHNGYEVSSRPQPSGVWMRKSL